MAESILTKVVNERYTEFLNKLIKFQKDQSMTNEQFSGFCEIGRSTWSNARCKPSKPKGHVLLKISIATGIPI